MWRCSKFETIFFTTFAFSFGRFPKARSVEVETSISVITILQFYVLCFLPAVRVTSGLQWYHQSPTEISIQNCLDVHSDDLGPRGFSYTGKHVSEALYLCGVRSGDGACTVLVSCSSCRSDSQKYHLLSVCGASAHLQARIWIWPLCLTRQMVYRRRDVSHCVCPTVLTSVWSIRDVSVVPVTRGTRAPWSRGLLCMSFLWASDGNSHWIRMLSPPG